MNFIGKNSIGLDIADRSVEVIEMAKRGNQYEVLSMGRAVLEKGVVERGSIRDEAKLAEAIREAMEKAVPQPIRGERMVFGFPESLVYTYIFDLEASKKTEIEIEVKKTLEKNIPLETDDLLYSFHVHEEKRMEEKNGEKKSTVVNQAVAIAISQKAGLEWMEFFQKQKLEVEFFDMETFSVFRSMANQLGTENVCILDIGAANTNIAIFSKNRLVYSYSLQSAGDKITKNLAEIRINAEGKKLGLKMAEKAKKKFGISEEWEFQKEAGLIIQNVLRGIANETKVAVSYVKSRYGITVEELILVGGTSKMKGIVEYFDKNVNDFSALSEQLLKSGGMNPASNPGNESVIAVRPGFSNYLPFETQMEFLEAIGLAIFGLDAKLQKSSPSIETKVFAQIKKSREEEIKTKKKAANPSQTKSQSWFKLHRKETQLLAIVIFGILLMAGAFWFRSYSDKKRQNEMPFAMSEEFVKKQIDIEIPLVFEARDLLPGRIRGKKIADSVDQAMELSAAVKESKARVESKLKKGELVWAEPINEGYKAEKLIFPLKFEWLAYHESDLRSVSLMKVKELMKEAVFTFDSLNLKAVDTSGSSTWTMISDVTLSIKSDSSILAEAGINFSDNSSSTPGNTAEVSPVRTDDAEEAGNAPVETAPIPAETSEVDDPKELSLEELSQSLLRAKGNESRQARILETSTGWLNARSGPGTDFEVVKRVYAEESYAVIEEKGEWINISFSPDESGWVSANYVIIE